MEDRVLKLCNCHLIPIDAEKVLLKSAHKTLELKGRDTQKLSECLLPKLNGNHTRLEIINQIPAELREEADELLTVLNNEGFLKEEQKSGILGKLAKSRVLLIGSGRLGHKISEDMKDSGFGQVTIMKNISDILQEWIPHLQDIDLAIVCTDTPRPYICTLVNKACLEIAQSWLLVQADDREGCVGPLFIPKETGCYTCFTYRLRANSAYSVAYSFEENTEILLPLYSLISGMATLEAIRHITGISRPMTYQAQIVTDGITGISGQHIWHRIPRCPDCSDSETMSVIQPFSG